jgi:hypothetical protein
MGDRTLPTVREKVPIREFNEFRGQLKKFLKEHQMGASTLGRYALGDSAFGGQVLRGERVPSKPTIEKVRRYMARHGRRNGKEK